MFIELVDFLRCLEPHEDTWLVAAVTRMDGRHVVDGVLGCPVCRREYPVRDGVGWFVEPSSGVPGSRLTPPALATGDLVERAAALLGLVDGGGIIVLGGAWTGCAEPLADLGPAHVIVLNALPPPNGPQEVSALRVHDRLPFAAASVRAAAIASGLSGPALMASAASTLRAGGRLVGPADAGVPEGVTELARDSVDWVGERNAVASAPVALRVHRR